MAQRPQTPPPPPPAAAPARPSTPATGDLRGIKPPVPIPSPWRWGILALAALALLALAWWVWRRRRARPVAAPVSVPPHVRARARLSEALRWIHDANRFCTGVSETLRFYLEERFALHAPERTTEEFLEELRASPVLGATQKLALADFLARCDLVKFARDEPAETELRGLWDTAMRLVEETSPYAAVTPEAGAAGATDVAAPTPEGTPG